MKDKREEEKVEGKKVEIERKGIQVRLLSLSLSLYIFTEWTDLTIYILYAFSNCKKPVPSSSSIAIVVVVFLAVVHR